MPSVFEIGPPKKVFTTTLHIPPRFERNHDSKFETLVARHGRFEWTFHAEKPCDYVHLGVSCRNLYEEDNNWIVRASFKVLSTDGDRFWTFDFRPQEPKLEWTSELPREPFPVKIVLFLEDNFKKFEEENEFSDICLMVGEKKFYLSKWLLINQTAHFKKMHEEGKLEQPIITLPEEDHSYFFNDFLDMLLGEKVVNDDNVYGLLKLAKHYGASLITNECKKFLMEKSNRSVKGLNEISEKFEMPEIKKLAVSRVTNFEELKLVLPNNLLELSKKEMIKFYEISFHHNFKVAGRDRCDEWIHGQRPELRRRLHEMRVMEPPRPRQPGRVIRGDLDANEWPPLG